MGCWRHVLMTVVGCMSLDKVSSIPVAVAVYGQEDVPAACQLDFNFFPTNATNSPASWSKANQTLAGNTANNELLDILTNGNFNPVINFAPDYYLASNGSAVPGACLPKGTVGGRVVTVPAQFTVTYTLTPGGKANTAGTVANSVGTVNLGPVQGFEDGRYCVSIVMTILANTATTTDPQGGGATTGPDQNVSANKTVCFVKFTKNPTFNFTYKSCQNPCKFFKAA